MDVTPEMIAAWRTLVSFAERFRHNTSIGGLAEACAAIDVLDNSDYMVPIEQAGECDYQVGGSHETPPEHCGVETDGGLCPRHQALADADSQLDPAEWGDTTREDMARHQDADRSISSELDMGGVFGHVDYPHGMGDSRCPGCRQG